MLTHFAAGFAASAANNSSSSCPLTPIDSISCSKSRNSNFSLFDILRFFFAEPLPSSFIEAAARGGDAIDASPFNAAEEPSSCAELSVSSLSAVAFEAPPLPV